MTDGCCPRFKQIEATIVRYKSKSDVKKCKSGKPYAEAQQENHQFHGRCSHLKSKLDEATSNIAMLRAWVSQADIDIKQTRPKTPKSKREQVKDMVYDLKDLIVKLNEYQHQAKIALDRSSDAVKILEEVQNQICFCGLVSESCEKIKRELAEIAEEKEEVEDTINQLKYPVEHENREDKLEAVRNEIEEAKACTVFVCPKINENSIESKPRFLDTGVQSNWCPSRIPKLMQTDTRRKWNQGTNPCCGGTSNKSTG